LNIAQANIGAPKFGYFCRILNKPFFFLQNMLDVCENPLQRANRINPNADAEYYNYN